MPARGHRQQPSVNGISFEEKVALWLAVDSENSYAVSLSESSMIQLDGCREVKRKLSGSSEHSAKRLRPSTPGSSSQDSQSTHDGAVVFAAGLEKGPYLGHVIFDADVNKVYEIKQKKYNEKLDVNAKLGEEEKGEAALSEDEKKTLKGQAETVRAKVEKMMLLSGRNGFAGKKLVLGDLGPDVLKVEATDDVQFVSPDGSTGNIRHAFRDATPYPAKGTDEEKKKWVEKVQKEAVPGSWKPDGLLVVVKADDSKAGIVIMEHKSDSGQADMNSKSLYATIALLKEIKVAGLLYLEPNGTYVMLAYRNETKKCIECEFKWLNVSEEKDAQELCVLIGALMKYGQHHLSK